MIRQKMTNVLIKIRVDFNGNRLGEPEIIEIIPGDGQGQLNKAARIYARMIKNELAAAVEETNLKAQKSERKSC